VYRHEKPGNSKFEIPKFEIYFETISRNEHAVQHKKEEGPRLKNFKIRKSILRQLKRNNTKGEAGLDCFCEVFMEIPIIA
jgi:hypothetical protein